ncbi:MAP2B, partial [Symbiodinium sp. KB8]
MEPVPLTAWTGRNPCEHVNGKRYFIGNLASSATNCTVNRPMTTYADNFQVCHACAVAGCDTCSKEDGCQECMFPLTRLLLGPDDAIGSLLGSLGSEDEKQCVSVFIFIFAGLLLFTMVFAVLTLLRFLCLSLVSARSPGALEHCLQHRRRAKVHNYSVPGNVFYPLLATNVQRENISGLAPALYFRHLAFQALLSFFLTVLSLIGYFLPNLTKDSASSPRLIRPEQLGLAQKLHAVMVFVFVFFAVIRWIWTQGRAARAEHEELPHISDYALMAEGFPKTARSPHEVKAFFESILGFEVEGVSIAYDLSEEADFVENRILRVAEQADAHLGVYPAELADVREMMASSQDGHVLDSLVSSGQAVVVFSREEDREFCLRRF